MNATRKQWVVGVGFATSLSVVSALSVALAQGPGTHAEQRARYGLEQAPQAVEPAQPQSLPSVATGRQLPLPTVPATPVPQASDAKAYCTQLLGAARAAMARGDLVQAEQYARQAAALNLPEASFPAKQDSPARLAWDLQMARYRNDAAVTPAIGVAGGPGVSQALHVGERDTTQNQLVAHETPANVVQLAQATGTIDAAALVREGEQLLRTGDFASALQRFEQANTQRGALSPAQQSRLDSHLKMFAGSQPAVSSPPAGSSAKAGSAASQGSGERLALPAPSAPATLNAPADARTLLDDAESGQQRLFRQLANEVGNKQIDAKRIRESDPRGSLQLLKDVRAEVENSKLADQYRGQLVRRIDSAIKETDRYISDHKAEIELDEANAAVLAEVERRRAANLRLQNRKAQLVDEFNKLRDEQRYAEAEIVAKRLYEMMGPHDEVAQVIMQTAKFLRREMLNRELLAEKESNNWETLNDVERSSSSPVGDGRELIYGKSWDQIRNRESLSQDNRLTPREVEIQRKLSVPVQVKYRNQPLSEVMDSLAKITGINIHLDQRGLSQEGVTSDTPVDIELTDPVMLKSALNLILDELHLSYLIKDEVLKITSQQLRNGELQNKVYYVADLVVPIPNFVPGSNFGLQGLINDAHRSIGSGFGGLAAPGLISQVQERPGTDGSPIPNDVVAQPNFGSGLGGGGGQGGIPFGGPGAAGGGGADADFDSLIDLIVSTVAAETWAESGGGEAEIRPYFNNLSLVISQTQDAHEQIADLLEQLRRLQDLQITIEVRFITLSDSFFEQIGIDFDVNINDEVDDLAPDADGNFETPSRGAVVGAVLGGDLPALTADLDIPFRQDSFTVATPTFGGPVAGAASFGFAILSDIEAFFLVTAAQGDSRTNVLEAPKVTLFNGQTAFIADTSQTPFVISVVPVVGEFAAAQQPVIVVLSEGTLMNINAVVSEDRRYVRLTVVPFFSQITDVDTFTFEGSTSTSTSSSTTDDDDDGTADSDADADDSVVAGTTVQLPTFAFISVATTVSVPDGGTVLLGGIKELDEGRTEFGVPLLSKIPYINRLFRNVGIGRDTSSLMFMVTPRIIIQEEEEERLGIAGT